MKLRLDKTINIIKSILYGARGEPFKINAKKYYFQRGSRPVRRKYINSKNDVVRNEVLQFEFVCKLLKPSFVFWDIGAHYGTYSLLASAYIAGENKIFAFEPDREARIALLKNLKFNRIEHRVRVFDQAIYSGVGEIGFDMQGGNANSHLIYSANTKIRGTVNFVKTTKLDTLMKQIPFPDVVKIDTEGAELEIIKGGEKLLSLKHIIFICELHPFAWDIPYESKWREFVGLVEKYGRVIKILDPQKSSHDLPFYGTIIF